MSENKHIEQSVENWLNDAVVGLNLCPFAAKPQRNGQIKIAVSNATEEYQLLSDILLELKTLEASQPNELETTLVVIPDMLQSFDDYNWYIDWVETLITENEWDGVFQVATFHPDYCFADVAPDDEENLTNRAPYPIFHLIREESMEKVLAHYPDPESIPDNNIARVKALTAKEKRQIFPYLFQ